MSLSSNDAHQYQGFLKSTFYLRMTIFLITILSGFTIFIGCVLNHLDHKYIRSKSNQSCQKEILNINVRDSNLCCERDYHDQDWVCVASFDATNNFLSSTYALFIPFIPFILTTLTELFLLFRQPSFNASRESGKECLRRLITASCFRAATVAILVATRTVSTVNLLISTFQTTSQLNV